MLRDSQISALDQAALGVVAIAAVGAAALQAGERLARRSVPLDLREQVVDCGVARAGDADAVAPRDQFEDQLRARVGLARARRPLNEQVAVVQAPRDSLRSSLPSVELDGLFWWVDSSG
jgi:hypothetical protein